MLSFFVAPLDGCHNTDITDGEPSGRDGGVVEVVTEPLREVLDDEALLVDDLVLLPKPDVLEPFALVVLMLVLGKVQSPTGKPNNVDSHTGSSTLLIIAGALLGVSGGCGVGVTVVSGSRESTVGGPSARRTLDIAALGSVAVDMTSAGMLSGRLGTAVDKGKMSTLDFSNVDVDSTDMQDDSISAKDICISEEMVVTEEKRSERYVERVLLVRHVTVGEIHGWSHGPEGGV